MTAREQWEADTTALEIPELKADIARLACQLRAARGILAKAKVLGWKRRPLPTLLVASETINGQEFFNEKQ